MVILNTVYVLLYRFDLRLQSVKVDFDFTKE